MDGGVVAEHEGPEVQLPVEGGLLGVDDGGGDVMFHLDIKNLSLPVARRKIRSGDVVADVQRVPDVLLDGVVELQALVRRDRLANTEDVEVVADGGGDDWGGLAGDSGDVGELAEGVGDDENKIVLPDGRLQGAEEIDVEAAVRAAGRRERLKRSGTGNAFVGGLKARGAGADVRVDLVRHFRPPKFGLDALRGLEDAAVAADPRVVCLRDDLGRHG